MTRALFIAVYGVNNIGKTTQVEKLVEHLNSLGYKAERIKYPVYDLPTGKKIDEILRGGKGQSISEEEFQMLYVKNREEYESTLIEKLESGIIIIAEDYAGTGIGWGPAKGGSYEWAKKVNAHLLKEDLAILMDGERFTTGREKVHIHEEDDSLVLRARKRFLIQAADLGYEVVNANQTIDAVFEDIIEKVREYTNLKV